MQFTTPQHVQNEPSLRLTRRRSATRCSKVNCLVTSVALSQARNKASKEISEMSPLAQVKILRVLEYGEFERLGSERMLSSNARIICASNCSLRERVGLGKSREDLYQRLNGLTLLIPPLRERLEELPVLIAAELKAAGSKEGKNITAIHPEAMQKLLHHEWRGNLRELSH